jgi:hypothetical protein
MRMRLVACASIGNRTSASYWYRSGMNPRDPVSGRPLFRIRQHRHVRDLERMEAQVLGTPRDIDDLLDGRGLGPQVHAY